MEKKELSKMIKSFQAQGTEPAYSIIIDDRKKKEYLEMQYGIEDCKIQYPTLLDFWLSSIFSYLEDCERDLEFATITEKSLCKSVSEDYMWQIINEKLVNFDSESKKDLILDIKLTSVLLMFQEENFLAFTGENKESYFSFFWEKYD